MRANDILAELLAVPPERRLGLRALLDALANARRVVLTTHVQADGDAIGSEVAAAAWLRARGTTTTIVNPTAVPDPLRFLLAPDDTVLEWDRDPAACQRALADADFLLVLDVSAPNRLGPVAQALERLPVGVLDHHEPEGPVLEGIGVRDPAAAATGEVVYDLIRCADGPWPERAVVGIYVALVSDTGSFRFTNTTPRAHLVAADLLARGVDPEQVYRHLFGSMPWSRVQLLREALAHLHREEEPLTWIFLPREAIDRARADHADFDGLIDVARSVEGTEVALLIRELPNGRTKISFRSNGPVDVLPLAQQFGGGGHRKAAAAVLDLPPQEAIPRVLDAVRRALHDLGLERRAASDAPVISASR